MMKLVVFSCLLAAASAGIVAPLTYGAFLAPGNYRGPVSLAPGQPASILAADGRPFDTLDVNLDRSAHYTAKALNGFHLLKKRSIVAPVVAPIAAPIVAAPVARFAAPLISHTVPFAYGAHIAPLAVSHAALTHVL
ncbi:PREDICTED: uncharacterized protein LOC106121096 [Papilio xuthus]|uniref:Uncharacterized protein LOC106121096 n=1 Tax=Papilio xuthus TaxID=66420 RepID=A0AAJ6ZGE8_PAPXU|nr:PREDICTED: uncharacterized protein LOC106121096 [Papilio xuthus]